MGGCRWRSGVTTREDIIAELPVNGRFTWRQFTRSYCQASGPRILQSMWEEHWMNLLRSKHPQIRPTPDIDLHRAPRRSVASDAARRPPRRYLSHPLPVGLQQQAGVLGAPDEMKEIRDAVAQHGEVLAHQGSRFGRIVGDDRFQHRLVLHL